MWLSATYTPLIDSWSVVTVLQEEPQQIRNEHLAAHVETKTTCPRPLSKKENLRITTLSFQCSFQI